jgi:hypothetical protein
MILQFTVTWTIICLNWNYVLTNVNSSKLILILKIMLSWSSLELFQGL